MRFASVILDIATRALESAFSYVIPADLDDVMRVGTTVLVRFSGRMAVGYVVGICDEPPASIGLHKLLPISQVLADSAFDEVGAKLALWMAREYACNPQDAIHPFLAPGQKVRVKKTTDGQWELVDKQMGVVDDRWVCLTQDGTSYEPRRTASRQRAVLEALRAGALRMTELRATVPGASATVGDLERKGVVEVFARRLVRGSHDTSLSSAIAPRPETLTSGQMEALGAIRAAMRGARGDVVLVDGVTGSGKTEVYLQAIELVLAQGRGAIVLVPEISLTAQTVGRFRARFGGRVAVLHSRLSDGERFDQWDLVRQGVARVVVGARSALFAPLADPGLIIIDEEHESSYKQDGPPRYHAREVAAMLARLRGCPLVLGSATPSVESLVRCSQGTWGGVSWTRVRMPERPGVSVLPKVRVVDMAAEFRGGGRSIFSAPLANALQEVVRRREKAVLLLNRRGFANFLMCRECGCVPECPHCSTSLTFHERTHTLACHTCGRSWPMRAFPDPATSCPNCGSRYMAALGVGTQRVEDELAMLLDDFARQAGGGDARQGRRGTGQADMPAKIIRMDADTTRGKDSHQRLLEQFDAADCAVLVGTQMIAKGLDFPEVTLVGVINADTTLKLPDFRAAERTYALLEQVSGRAGRGGRPGEVIVQTYWASHPAIQAVVRHDRSLLLETDLSEREMVGYPPYRRLANVIVSGVDERLVRACCDDLARRLRSRLDGLEGWEVLGPVDCVKAKVKDRHRRHVLVKAPPEAGMGEVLRSCVRELRPPNGISVGIDVDAHDMM